jgi:type I restriction enzyme R subunit
MAMAFRNGFISISGIAFAQILPAVSRFSKDNKREEIRQRVFEKLSAYLDKFKDLSNPEEENLTEEAE